MGHLTYKVKQLFEGAAADLHGGVLAVEDDAVLLIIGVGGILHIPILTSQFDGHNTVILAGREIAASAVSGIFHAKHALRIAHAGRILKLGDLLRIFFRLGEVDSDLELPCRAVSKIPHVLRNGIYFDIVAGAAHLVETISRLFGIATGNILQESFANCFGCRRQQTHDASRKQITGIAHVLDQALLYSQVAKPSQESGCRCRHNCRDRRFPFRSLQIHHIKQKIAIIRPVNGLGQIVFFSKSEQFFKQLRRFFSPIHSGTSFCMSGKPPSVS